MQRKKHIGIWGHIVHRICEHFNTQKSKLRKKFNKNPRIKIEKREKRVLEEVRARAIAAERED